MPHLGMWIGDTMGASCSELGATAQAQSVRLRLRGAAQIKAMTEDDMAHWWGLYIEKLTALLAEADARPHGPAPHTARRIQALQREALFLHIRQAKTPPSPLLTPLVLQQVPSGRHHAG